jgi:hypothetical protein
LADVATASDSDGGIAIVQLLDQNFGAALVCSRLIEVSGILCEVAEAARQVRPIVGYFGVPGRQLLLDLDGPLEVVNPFRVPPCRHLRVAEVIVVDRLHRESAEAERDYRRAGQVLLDAMAISRRFREEGQRAEQWELYRGDDPAAGPAGRNGEAATAGQKPYSPVESYQAPLRPSDHCTGRNTGTTRLGLAHCHEGLGQLVLAWKVIRRWGIRGLRRILRSERVFSSEWLGYGIVVGTRR